MKKFIFLFFFLLYFILISANPVSPSKAKKVLNSFLIYKNKSVLKIKKVDIVNNKNKKKLAYIYQLFPTGFVAISADDKVMPIIAYSFKNNLITHPDNLIYYMIKKDIELRISHSPEELKNKAKKDWEIYLLNSKGKRNFQQWPAPGCTQTDGWVEDRWNQTGVYNRFCPLDGENRSVVGCVATALSMIINFHQYVGNIQFSDTDDYISGWDDQMHIDDDYQERDYPSFPELNQHLLTLKNHYENHIPLTNDDKSALCFAAGIAVHMIYGANASGAWVSEVQTALLNKFGYQSADYVDEINNLFYQNLSNNMKAMKPAELAIYTSGWNNGHAIICDGYNTDNYFHLNYGWGSSDNTCWYSLPQGMPYGYSILANAVINIEGGEIPTHLHGTVYLDNESPVDTYIKFENDSKIFEAFVNLSNGEYDVPAIESGTYIVTAIKQDENLLFYKQMEMQISGEEQVLNIYLDTYNPLSISINAPINPIGTHVQLFQNGELKYQGSCENENGQFSIAGVLPGEYDVYASLSNNLFAYEEFNYSFDNQQLVINLQEYPYAVNVGFHNFVSDRWHLINNYTLSCGIKLSYEELINHQTTPLSKVIFKSPISESEGGIFIQLWKGNELLEEKQVQNIVEGEWISETFNNFYLLDPDKEYYIGYKINTQNGYFAYFDNGPRIEGKGAFYRTTSWNQVPISVLNANFCINAGFLSQSNSYISGIITTNDNYQELQNGVVKANNYICKVDENGNYILYLLPGTYNVSAYLPEHSSFTYSDILVNENEQIENLNFYLNYQPQASENDIISNSNISIKSYPNPFIMSKNKTSIISFDLIGNNKKDTKLKIYNLLGQLVKTIYLKNESTVYWKVDKNVSSGLYFYKLESKKKKYLAKKLLIIK